MRFFIVDCFAEEPYQGNQLLVAVPGHPVGDQVQQAMAREINFSETAFVLSPRLPDGSYDVRIWTPNVGEVPFAGHPTLGTAHVVRRVLEREAGVADPERPVLLNLPVGQIPVAEAGEGLVMSQKAPSFGGCYAPAELAGVFGIDPSDIRPGLPIQWVSTGLPAVLVPLASRGALTRLRQDKERFGAYVGRHPECNCNHLFWWDEGVGTEGRATTLYARCLMEDFVEDPATGSANGDLAAYLVERAYFGASQATWRVVQGEDMGRTSVLEVAAAHVAGTGENGGWTIRVGGRCHVVAQGQWG